MVKNCDRCNAEFHGFGTTCAECRKVPDKSTGPKKDGSGCAVCGKTVYPMEKTEIEGLLLHTACFRCHKCNTKLSPAKFARTPAGVFYCPTHYKELFRLRGKYDEDETGLAKAVNGVLGTGNMHSEVSGIGEAEVIPPAEEEHFAAVEAAQQQAEEAAQEEAQQQAEEAAQEEAHHQEEELPPYEEAAQQEE